MFDRNLNTPLIAASVLNNTREVLKQSFAAVFQNLKNFANFAGKHLCWSLFLIKLQVASPQVCNFIKKKHSNTGVFLWNLQSFKDHHFLQNTSGGFASRSQFLTSKLTNLNRMFIWQEAPHNIILTQERANRKPV